MCSAPHGRARRVVRPARQLGCGFMTGRYRWLPTDSLVVLYRREQRWHDNWRRVIRRNGEIPGSPGGEFGELRDNVAALLKVAALVADSDPNVKHAREVVAAQNTVVVVAPTRQGPPAQQNQVGRPPGEDARNTDFQR